MSKSVRFKLSGNNLKFCQEVANGLGRDLHDLAKQSLMELCVKAYNEAKKRHDEEEKEDE